MRVLLLLVLNALLISCASGKIGKVSKAIDRSQVTKEDLITVMPITTENVRFDGDKAQDEIRIAEEKKTLRDHFHKMIVTDLRERGFKAEIGEGKPNGVFILKGDVKFFDHGSGAARAMVGMGAGSSNLYTDFELIRASDKTVMTKFEVIATSGGRGGLASMGSFIDAHLEDGAEKAAEYITGIND